MGKNKNIKIGIAKLVCLICLLSVLLVSVFSLFSCQVSEGDNTLTKDEIARNIENLENQEKDYKYAASYIEDYGIWNFDKAKFKKIELYFYTFYIKKIESAHFLAHQTATLFLDYFYDNTDLDDKTSVTDGLIECFVFAMGDPYAVYRTKEQLENYSEDMSGSFVGIGVSVRYNKEKKEMFVESVNQDSAAQKAGIKAGDYIVAVDGKAILDMTYDEALHAIRGEVGTKVKISVNRDGKNLDFDVVRIQLVEKTVHFLLDKDNIGYIKVTRFKENTVEQFCEAMNYMEEKGALGVVFDMRNNPGGYLSSVVDVLDRLVPKGTRIASYNYKSREGEKFFAKTDQRITVPCTVICNGNTASAGELFTAAIRDFAKMGLIKAKIVGETTYKKGVMQSTYVFNDHSALTMTVALYNPPSDVNYDGIGVIPDVKVQNSENKDIQLQTAKKELNKILDRSEDANVISA